METPEIVPQSPHPVATGAPGSSWKTIALLLIAVFAIVAGYIVAAQRFAWWPHGSDQTPSVMSATYEDDIYGFTVQYPSSWHVEKCRDTGPGGTYEIVALGDAERLIVCNSDAPFEGIVQMGVAPGTTTSQQELESTMAALDQASRKTVTIDGTSATRIEGITKETEGPGPGPGKKFIMVAASRGGDGYRFIFIGDPARAREFENVVATFHFGTNVTAHTEWKTYRNDAYQFTIQYPGNAQFSEGVPNADGYIAYIVLAEGGQINITEGVHAYGILSSPESVMISDVAAQRFNYRTLCNGILARIPRPSTTIEIAYDDCYAGGKSPTFPSAEQLKLFNQILDTFKLRN